MNTDPNRIAIAAFQPTKPTIRVYEFRGEMTASSAANPRIPIIKEGEISREMLSAMTPVAFLKWVIMSRFNGRKKLYEREEKLVLSYAFTAEWFFYQIITQEATTVGGPDKYRHTILQHNTPVLWRLFARKQEKGGGYAIEMHTIKLGTVFSQQDPHARLATFRLLVLQQLDMELEPGKLVEIMHKIKNQQPDPHSLQRVLQQMVIEVQ